MPLAVLGAVHGAPSVAGNLAYQDAELSHPSTVIGTASAAFVVASSSLISTGGDRAAALSEVQQWAKREHEAAVKGRSAPVEVEGPQGWTHLSSGVQERVQNRDSGASEKWTPPGDKLVMRTGFRLDHHCSLRYRAAALLGLVRGGIAER